MLKSVVMHHGTSPGKVVSSPQIGVIRCGYSRSVKASGESEDESHCARQYNVDYV